MTQCHTVLQSVLVTPGHNKGNQCMRILSGIYLEIHGLVGSDPISKGGVKVIHWFRCLLVILERDGICIYNGEHLLDEHV